jgi:lysophospholipid acyltransferase (LPLAT)-like uncharacterized protein
MKWGTSTFDVTLNKEKEKENNTIQYIYVSPQENTETSKVVLFCHGMISLFPFIWVTFQAARILLSPLSLSR